MSKLYYTPPRQELFEAVKSRAMELWKEIDTDNDEYGYATEKINRIKDLKNIGDNFMTIIAMFDINNQGLLADRLAEETRNAIRERMIDGGNSKEYIVF
jgi:DNA-binding MltR family transcriptional regulator